MFSSSYLILSLSRKNSMPVHGTPPSPSPRFRAAKRGTLLAKRHAPHSALSRAQTFRGTSCPLRSKGRSSGKTPSHSQHAAQNSIFPQHLVSAPRKGHSPSKYHIIEKSKSHGIFYEKCIKMRAAVPAKKAEGLNPSAPHPRNPRAPPASNPPGSI